MVTKSPLHFERTGMGIQDTHAQRERFSFEHLRLILVTHFRERFSPGRSVEFPGGSWLPILVLSPVLSQKTWFLVKNDPWFLKVFDLGHPFWFSLWPVQVRMYQFLHGFGHAQQLL